MLEDNGCERSAFSANSIIFVGMKAFHIRDARPTDAPFLAECIMAGMHFTDFDKFMTGDMSDILGRLTLCEKRPDILCNKNVRRNDKNS